MVDALKDERVLELVRRSSIKDEWARIRENESSKEKPLKPLKRWQEDTKIPAVEYVEKERKRQGLEGVRKEMADIEEALLQKEWREKEKIRKLKGADVNSDLDSYLDTQTFSRKVATANWADKVARELVSWVNKPRPLD